MKYLIAGLGNIGDEYRKTRHNIGFTILDALAKASNIVFEDKRYAFVSRYKFKGRLLVLIKPTTFMNLSGKAVNYWLQKEDIPIEKLLVVVDDIALPVGTIRIKPGGNDGGHNGLAHINEVLGTNNYARLRFGIGSDFPRGRQVEHVLGPFSPDEEKLLPAPIEKSIEAIKCFGTMGLQHTMTFYNNK